MIFRTQPKKKWSVWDFALVEAFQTLEDEKCSQCGNPVWLCRSNSNKFTFKVKKETCYATKALENYKDSNKPAKERAKSSERKDWGNFYYTEPEKMPFEDEMPTRDDFLREKYGLIE